jgi:uncharacterized protein (DUF1697 family)
MPARRLIVLLRGVNLARNRRLAMADLRRLLEELGYEDARTHGQSGNAVLKTAKAPAAVKRELEQRIAADLGLETEVFVRTRDELADVIARDPFGDAADNPSRYQVSFLSARPPARAVRELEAADVAPERVAVSGKELYAWHPNGLQRSPLAKLLSEQRLGVRATARNWNTVTKLLALADA